MNKAELKQAVAWAKSDKTVGDIPECMNGCAMSDFTPGHVTVRDVAALIRYQAHRMNGDYDSDEINFIAYCGRKNFTIIG